MHREDRPGGRAAYLRPSPAPLAVRSRYKIFSDPVHGFVSVPQGLPLALLETPEVQRLRRIRQLGLGHLVFPGAEHTRFEHALGAMALMQDALAALAEKGTPISRAEAEAALCVALLHDVGHGPFSHTLETDLIGAGADGQPFHHEAMSRALIQRLDRRLGGRLGLALRIFDDAYERPFFYQLVASQLDVDRLDYLRRDSFYTGVAEGVVGVDRIIKTLRVHPLDGGADARVVVEAKGAYAVESYVLARRLMYWQVYLHKTVIAGDHLLRAAFRRARRACERGDAAALACAPALAHFLCRAVTADDLDDPATLDAFGALDDTDVLFSLKQWMRADDHVLADLARRFIHRDLFRTTYLDHPPSPAEAEAWAEGVRAWLVQSGISAREDAAEDATYYLALGESALRGYSSFRDAICILSRDGQVRDLADAADIASVGSQAAAVVKPYVCLPKSAPVPVPQPA